MAKHRLTDEQAIAVTVAADMDRMFKERGIDKQIRALMTPEQHHALDRTLRDHQRRQSR